MATKSSAIWVVDRTDWTGEVETVETFHSAKEARDCRDRLRTAAMTERLDSRPRYTVSRETWTREA